MASASDVVSDASTFSAPVLSLPDFPAKILNEAWVNNRQDSKKLNLAAYSVRCTLAAMSGMHVHKMGSMRKGDIHANCEKVYHQLVAAMQRHHRTAAVSEYVGYTSLTKVSKMSDDKIFRMAQEVRSTLVNSFNRLWNACLQDGKLPSDKTWDWVRMRVLVMLYTEN